MSFWNDPLKVAAEWMKSIFTRGMDEEYLHQLGHA